MAGNLNARTRQVVEGLCNGIAQIIGGKKIDPLAPEAGRLLTVLAANLSELRDQKGGELAREVAQLYKQAEGRKEAGEQVVEAVVAARTPWTVSRVRACSFRGIAPAGFVWEHDFDGRSHLFFGPHGSGKSSLLGSVTWCLTGRIFRDDRPPSIPEDVTVFSAAKRPEVVGVRSDGLTLTDESGASTPLQKEYWVEVCFRGGDGKTLWLRRHSVDGLSKSEDGQTWTLIGNLEEVGISALDTELQLLMPARVPYIQFGKDNDLIGVFSQVVGLDDLEEIAELAGRAHSALSREVTRLEQNELGPLQVPIADSVALIDKSVPDSLRSSSAFSKAIGTARTIDDVREFGQELNLLIEKSANQLAQDLGVAIGDGNAPNEGKLKENVTNLPGHVQSATEDLQRNVVALFSTSLGLKLPPTEEIEALSMRLGNFELDARARTESRLAWGLRAAADAKMELMLKAAAYFPEESSLCPVCSQDLERAPAARATLEELRSIAKQLHLQQAVQDLELALLAELEEFLPSAMRKVAEESMCDRIRADWTNLKAVRFPGLLAAVAARFDASVEAVAEDNLLQSAAPPIHLGAGFKATFPGAFARLDVALVEAHRYIRFVQAARQSTKDNTEKLQAALSAEKARAGQDSLLLVLRRGKTVNEQLRSLDAIRTAARELYKNVQRESVIAAQIEVYQKVAEASEPSKALGQTVRQEVIDVMKNVEPRMRANYESLYRDDRLSFDMVTTGHAANPKVRNELNVYLRAGGERVPIGPYANAGRLRALTLSFVFALLAESQKSLSLLILDDPALSLDDDHKARLLDHLIRPCLDGYQVLLGTHYETFYKLAEPIFGNAERLQLAPRRTVQDAVAFEPADLLQRCELALQSSTCSWREAGINLRRWAERVLHTLSGYCPKPFVRFSDFPGSVAAYKAIADPGVATQRRDKIVAALSSVEFDRVLNRLAHDEEPTDTEVQDGLACLKGCRKEADAEIARLRQLRQHDVLGRAVAQRPLVVPLQPTAVTPQITLRIEGAAAAAHNGVGITWSEQAIVNLNGHGLALVKVDTIAPIATVGQFLLLDPDGSAPKDQDLVVVQTEEGGRYVRRFWSDEYEVQLQSVNPNMPYAPVRIKQGEFRALRVLGVLFEGVCSCDVGGTGEEWVCPGNAPTGLLSDIFGVRVQGSSMEPVARGGQIVLVRKRDVAESIPHGALACVDIRDTGAVIKRCYPHASGWVLCPVNQVDTEAPIRVAPGEILHAYLLAGVLFETNGLILTSEV